MDVSIHTSDRGNFKRCRQKWDFSSNIRGNLEPKKVVTPLWFGTGIHEALAAYYDPTLEATWERPDSPGARNPEFSLSVFQGYVQGWLNSMESPGEDQLIWAKENLELGLGMLEGYLKWAPKRDDFEVIWVEKEFKVGIPGMPGVSYSFRCDGLVKDKDERIWLLEHKTTAQFPESTEYLLMDDQVGSYLWGLTQLDPPVYAEGVIYNELKKKTPMPLRELVSGGFSVNRQQDTTFEIALSTLRGAYGTIPRHYHEFLDYLKYKPNNFIRRYPVRRNRREIEILGTSLRYEVLDMLNNPSIYRSPSRINCMSCPFASPCILKYEGNDFEQLLDWEFKPREGYYGKSYS